MSETTPKELVAQMSPTGREALEAAVAEAAKAGHHEVTVEHLLAQIVAKDDADVAAMFRYVGLPRAPLTNAIEHHLKTLRGGHTARPVFSPKIFAWLEAASSALPKGTKAIRTSRLFAVLLDDTSGLLEASLDALKQKELTIPAGELGEALEVSREEREVGSPPRAPKAAHAPAAVRDAPEALVKALSASARAILEAACEAAAASHHAEVVPEHVALGIAESDGGAFFDGPESARARVTEHLRGILSSRATGTGRPAFSPRLWAWFEDAKELAKAREVSPRDLLEVVLARSERHLERALPDLAAAPVPAAVPVPEPAAEAAPEPVPMPMPETASASDTASASASETAAAPDTASVPVPVPETASAPDTASASASAPEPASDTASASASETAAAPASAPEPAPEPSRAPGLFVACAAPLPPRDDRWCDVWAGPRHRIRRVGSASPVFASTVGSSRHVEALLYVHGPDVDEGSTVRRLCERVAASAEGTVEEHPAHPAAADFMKPKRAKKKSGGEWSDAELKKWWKENDAG